MAIIKKDECINVDETFKIVDRADFEHAFNQYLIDNRKCQHVMWVKFISFENNLCSICAECGIDEVDFAIEENKLFNEFKKQYALSNYSNNRS